MLGIFLSGIFDNITKFSLPVIAVVAGVTALIAGLGAIVIYWKDIKKWGVDTFNSIYAALKPVIDAVTWLAKNSPVGLAMRAGNAVAGWFSGGDKPANGTPGVAARSAAAQAGGGQQRFNGQVSVKFDNAPPGMRVEKVQSDGGVAVDADVGHNMAAVQ